MGSQVESSPSHGECEDQPQPASPSAPNKCHETQSCGYGSMPGGERSVGMASDDPTSVLSWTEPTLLHQYLRSGPPNDRPQSRARNARENAG